MINIRRQRIRSKQIQEPMNRTRFGIKIQDLQNMWSWVYIIRKQLKQVP